MTAPIPEKYSLHLALMMEKIEKRGSPRVTRMPLTQCWTHDTSIIHLGYGQITIKGKYWLLHRLSWWLHNGCPEDKTHNFWNSHKFHVAHQCDNYYCCNPEHLELEPCKKNIGDGVKLREEKREKPVKQTHRNSEPCFACVENHKSCHGGIPCDRCKSLNIECIKKEYKPTPGAFSKGNCSGESNAHCKLSDAKILEIHTQVSGPLPHGGLKKIAEEVGISYNLIQKIRGGTYPRLQELLKPK